ncbi:MAG TPA: conserved phage C-terminal domain-containing protein [Solibacillus sp.]
MNLLTTENPLIVLPQLACVIGLEETILLQQLHYRLQQQKDKHNGEIWYCQPHAKWQEQLPFWNTPKIKRTLRKLEDLAIVHSTDQFNQFQVDRTKWYKIDYEKLQSLIDNYKQLYAIDEDDFAQLSASKTFTPTPKPKRNKSNAQNKAIAKQIDEVLLYLNERASKNFSLKSQANRNFISGRLKEGHSVNDCRLVIDEQVSCWLHDAEMEKYLRPMTLFRPANFESYLNNALSKKYKPAPTPQPVVLDFNAGEEF